MTNIIHSSFRHGKNLKMGHFCVIDEDVIVGDDVVIENYVLLKKGTRIGDRTFVDSYVRSSGDNHIGNDVTLRYGSTIAKKVTIEDGAFIAPNVMTIFSTHRGEESTGTVIGQKAFIGTAAVLGAGVTIGAEVVIGAMAFVSKDCLDKGIYRGIPARRVG